jgi:hypothetical protein
LWNYIDRSGKMLCPSPFRVTGYFSEGLAPVVAEKGPQKAGYIDATCKTVLEAQYDTAMSFSEGLALVLVFKGTRGFGGTGSWYYIDRTGKRVIEVKEGDPRSFDGGFAAVALYEEFINRSSTGLNRFLKGTYYLDREEGKRIAPKYPR